MEYLNSIKVPNVKARIVFAEQRNCLTRKETKSLLWRNYIIRNRPNYFRSFWSDFGWRSL